MPWSKNSICSKGLSPLVAVAAVRSKTVVLFLLCPRHNNGRGIKCYPCPSVRTYGHTNLRTYVRLSKRRPLSNSNTFDQNFMKLGHIVKYHDVFFKFSNGSYRTMLSVVMALCLWKFTIFKDVRSLSQIVLIRILWHLVTLLSTMMSFLVR